MLVDEQIDQVEKVNGEEEEKEVYTEGTTHARASGPEPVWEET